MGVSMPNPHIVQGLIALRFEPENFKKRKNIQVCYEHKQINSTQRKIRFCSHNGNEVSPLLLIIVHSNGNSYQMLYIIKMFEHKEDWNFLVSDFRFYIYRIKKTSVEK